MRVTAVSVGSGIALTVTVVADSPETAWRACAAQMFKPFRDHCWHDGDEIVSKVLDALRQ